MDSHRSWFPYILIGLSLALMALIAVTYDRKEGIGGEEGEGGVGMTVPTTAEYEAAMQGILAAYDVDGNAQKAYDALVATTVPTVSYQAVHLELVIALAQIAGGNTEEGTARFDLARVSHVWLH